MMGADEFAPQTCSSTCVRGDKTLRCGLIEGHGAEHWSNETNPPTRWASAPKLSPVEELQYEDQTAGRKFDTGKPRWDLIPWKALSDVVDVLTKGAEKYAPDNWRKVEGWRWRYARAAIGHIVAFMCGEKNDPEWGLPHLAHATCCILFLLELDQ